MGANAGRLRMTPCGKPGAASALMHTPLQWATQHAVRRILLGTTDKHRAAHDCYEKNGFLLMEKTALPASFSFMAADTRLYQLNPTTFFA